MVIGITGKYCSGKNFVARFIEKNNFFMVDVDAIGHLVLQDKKDAVIAAFGSRVAGTSGLINRKALGSIVFKNRKKLQLLEQLLHPEMVKRIRVELAPHKNTLINAALLFQMGLARLCDAVIIVNAPLFKRISRARKRDGLGIPAILHRILSQMKILSNINSTTVDIYRVDNYGDEQSVAAQIERILKKIVSGK